MALRTCMFTNTPDEHFILDVLPEYPQVVVASPCSGHGFKFASVIGEILADLAQSGETRHDIELLRLSRFAENPDHRAVTSITATASILRGVHSGFFVRKRPGPASSPGGSVHGHDRTRSGIRGQPTGISTGRSSPPSRP